MSPFATTNGILSFRQKALFDVTMGSYDGAESCELVGTYLPHNIKERFSNACNFGFYRDDRPGVTKASPRQAELIKKELRSIFAKYGLKITIEANKKVVNFLDVILKGTGSRFSACSFSKMLFFCRDMLYRLCKEYDHVIIHPSYFRLLLDCLQSAFFLKIRLVLS